MQQQQRYPSQGPPMRNYPQPGYAPVCFQAQIKRPFT